MMLHKDFESITPVNSSGPVSVERSYAIGSPPRSDRESHTVDLLQFDERLKQLEETQRAPTDLPYNENFWHSIRSQLAQCVEPVGYGGCEAADQVQPKGPEDVNLLFQRIMQLGLFNPIYPKALASHFALDEAAVLTELLYATKVGMMSMRWAPECTRCGSAVLITELLNELPSQANCGGCQEHNHIDSLDHIMVTFNLNPEILYILANNYACTPSSTSMEANAAFLPMLATHNGSGFRYSFGCGEHPMSDALASGVYRMHCPVSMTDNYLTVERDAHSDDEPCQLSYRISEHVVVDPLVPRNSLTVPHGKVHFDLYPDTQSFFVLWVQEDLDEETLLCLPHHERSAYTSAAEVINHSAFHLFSTQLVPHGTHPLEIKDVTLVFTDIVGSTDLYARLGDGEALRLVREHFRAVFNSFAARGRIVKTIGDAVMASFSSGSIAIQAVAEAFKAVAEQCIHPVSGEVLELRIGIHKGETTVIPVNGINDYFGQTVNIAARVQSAAGASECFISEEVLQDRDAYEALEKLIESELFEGGAPQQLSLKGVQRQVSVSPLSFLPKEIDYLSH